MEHTNYNTFPGPGTEGQEEKNVVFCQMVLL